MHIGLNRSVTLQMNASSEGAPLNSFFPSINNENWRRDGSTDITENTFINITFPLQADIVHKTYMTAISS